MTWIAPSLAMIFLDPLPVDAYWLWLLLPLVLAVSVVYRAIKLDDLNQLPRQALILAVQIVFFMALAAGALWVVTELA